jgi:hypothetical protein
MTCQGIPNFKITCLKNKVAVSTSVIFVIVGINILYLVNLSTITKMLSNPLDKGSSGIKSIDTTLKGWDGMGIGCNNLAGV